MKIHVQKMMYSIHILGEVAGGRLGERGDRGCYREKSHTARRSCPGKGQHWIFGLRAEKPPTTLRPGIQPVDSRCSYVE